MAKDSYYIVALPGDGIGPEVLECALKVLQTVGELFRVDLNVESIPCGGHYYVVHETEWPEGSFEKCQAADAILLGAVGHDVDGKPVFTKPGKPYPEPQLAGFAQVIANRQKLDLYANVRPVKLYPGIRHKIHGEFLQVWQPGKVDYVVVRENTEDAYTGEMQTIEGGRITPIRITRKATERVVRYAFNLARRRNKQKKVTCVDKSNIVGAHRYFRDVFREIGLAEFPDIILDYAYVDAFCQWQIRNPEWYDVVVGPNLVGDITSDNGATTAGGLGLAVGGNIGDEHAMFEPIHGSAPKHAGKDKANPMASILAMQMMLDWLGVKYTDDRLTKAAGMIEAAVAAVIAEGKTLTYDLVGEEKAAKCSEVGAAVDERLRMIFHSP
ncbi:MAG: isocitrate/isopropylmalate dehydrogenase family protein [Acidobacteria bacterium]|nr:isocitrate/isopropylmalate dehydrogenase family protein [Acidobacteriota bacterium]